MNSVYKHNHFWISILLALLDAG